MQDIKSKIKVVAAALAGGLMLGATMAGAVAADLGTLPTGFVDSQGWHAQIVIGANAKVADVIAAAQIAAAMAPYTVSASAAGSATTTTGKTEEVAIGGEFSKTMTTGLYPALLGSGKYTIYDENNTKHEIPYVEYYSAGAKIDSLNDLGVSITDDTKSIAHNIYAKLEEGNITYYIDFKGGVDASWISSDNPLEISLLGYKIKITGFSDGSPDSITVRVGEPQTLQPGQSTTYSGHTVTVNSVEKDENGKYFAWISVDGGTAKQIYPDQGKTFVVGDEEIQVTVDSISLPWDPSAGNPTVKILVGSETSATYEDGEGFLSEADKDNPVNWEWYIDVQGTKLMKLGVKNVAKNAYDVEDTTHNMIPMGDAFALPDNSIVFKMTGLTTEDDHYYVKAYVSNGKVIVTINNDYGFQAGSGADYTDKFEILGTYISAGKLLVKYKTTLQDNPDYTEFNVTLVQDGVADFNDGTNDWYINAGSAGQDIKIQVVDLKSGGNDFSAANFTPGLRFYIVPTGENITIPFQNAATITYLGNAADDDSNEVMYGTTAVGDKDYKIRFNYGGYIKAGKDVDDTVEIYFPIEQAKVKVYVGAPSGESTAAGVTYNYAGITSEVAVLDNEASTDMPVIIVGGPYVNSLAADLIGTDDNTIRTFFGADEGGYGIVKLYDASETPWNQPALLVAGWAAKDTRAAAYVLSQYLSGVKSKSELSGHSMFKVTAASPTSPSEPIFE